MEIIEVKEFVYLGFKLVRDDVRNGWFVQLEDCKAWFPYMQDAQTAVRKFHACVKEKNGKIID